MMPWSHSIHRLWDTPVRRFILSLLSVASPPPHQTALLSGLMLFFKFYVDSLNTHDELD